MKTIKTALLIGIVTLSTGMQKSTQNNTDHLLRDETLQLLIRKRVIDANLNENSFNGLIQISDSRFSQYLQDLIHTPKFVEALQSADQSVINSFFRDESQDIDFVKSLVGLKGSSCDQDESQNTFRYCTSFELRYFSKTFDSSLSSSNKSQILASLIAQNIHQSVFPSPSKYFEGVSFFDEFSKESLIKKRVLESDPKLQLKRVGRVLGLGINVQGNTAYVFFVVANAYSGPGPRLMDLSLQTPSPSSVNSPSKKSLEGILSPSSDHLPEVLKVIKNSFQFNLAITASPAPDYVLVAFTKDHDKLSELLSQHLRAFSTSIDPSHRVNFYEYKIDQDQNGSGAGIGYSNYKPTHPPGPGGAVSLKHSIAGKYPILLIYKKARTSRLELYDAVADWNVLEDQNQSGQFFNALSNHWGLTLKNEVSW